METPQFRGVPPHLRAHRDSVGDEEVFARSFWSKGHFLLCPGLDAARVTVPWRQEEAEAPQAEEPVEGRVTEGVRPTYLKLRSSPQTRFPS